MSVLSETLAGLDLGGLALNQNRIGDEGVISLTKVMHSTSKIHALWLENIGMTDDSMPEFASALSNLKQFNSLWIRNNDITTEESFSLLRDGLSGRKLQNLLYDLCEESSVLFKNYETEKFLTTSS